MDDKMFKLDIFREWREEKISPLAKILAKNAHLINSPFKGRPLGPVGFPIAPIKYPKLKGVPIFGTGLCVVKRNGEFVCERVEDNIEDEDKSTDDSESHKFVLEWMSNEEIEDMIYIYSAINIM